MNLTLIHSQKTLTHSRHSHLSAGTSTPTTMPSFNTAILCPIIMLVLSIYLIYIGVVSVAMNNAMNPKSDFQMHSDGCRIANVSDVEQIYAQLKRAKTGLEQSFDQHCENLYTYNFALLEDTARKTFFSQQIWAGTQDSCEKKCPLLCESTDKPVVLPNFETNQTVDCWTPVETLSPDVLSFYCPKCVGNNFWGQCHSGTVPNAKECTTLLDPSVTRVDGGLFFLVFGILLLLCTFCACFFVCGLQPNYEFKWPWSKSEKEKRAEREKRRERELDAI